MRILVVEDDPELARLVHDGLERAGHGVDVARSGEAALEGVDDAEYDAIVLDVMLPGIDGFEVCRRLRHRGSGVPILMLTARDAVADRVAGLDAGADDYLVKPFAFAELLARLRALARRPAASLDSILKAGEIRLDPATRRVWRGDEEVELTRREFAVLDYLMRNPGRVVTRAMIVDRVWDYDFPNSTNVVDVHVGAIRRKLGDPAPGELIQTVRGVGYRLVDR
jgi:two-component system, OmpR family, response regulator